MKTNIIISVVVSVLLIGGAYVLSKKSNLENEDKINNVSIIDGKQIIDIKAKGGFYPKKSTAKSSVPTILRINTDGTFDCSSVVRIPSMNISKNLPQSGVTDIDLGSPKEGVVYGTCGMGMYPFEIDFQD